MLNERIIQAASHITATLAADMQAVAAAALLATAKKVQPAQAAHAAQQQPIESDGASGSSSSAVATASTAAGVRDGLTLGQTATSLFWLPAAKAWLQGCSSDLLLAVASAVDAALVAAESGGHVIPQIMEQIQDAISVLYYTLQHHGHHAATAAGRKGHNAILLSATAMLRALKVCSFGVCLHVQPGLLFTANLGMTAWVN